MTEQTCYQLLWDSEKRAEFNDIITCEIGGLQDVDWTTLAEAIKTATKEVLTIAGNKQMG